MEGIMNYADFEHSSNFSHVGLNVADVFTKPYIKTESGTVTVADALRNDLKYGKVYVMLGINELGWYNLDKFIEYYGNIVDLLRETHPEAQIYIISILPVGAKATASQKCSITTAFRCSTSAFRACAAKSRSISSTALRRLP